MDSVDVGPDEEASGELLYIVPPDTVADGQIAYGRMAYIIDGVPLGWWALSR